MLYVRHAECSWEIPGRATLFPAIARLLTETFSYFTSLLAFLNANMTNQWSTSSKNIVIYKYFDYASCNDQWNIQSTHILGLQYGKQSQPVPIFIYSPLGGMRVNDKKWQSIFATGRDG